MASVTQPVERPAQATEHVDVLIVGAGVSGIGVRVPPPARAAGQELRDPRGPRRDRRHVGPVPLPGYPLGLRPAHLRLRVQAVANEKSIADGAGDPRLHPRDGDRERDRVAHPLRPPRRARPSGRASDARWTVARASVATRASRCRFTCSWLFCASGYYRYERGLHARRSRAPSASPGRSSTRSTGPRTSTTRASASS